MWASQQQSEALLLDKFWQWKMPPKDYFTVAGLKTFKDTKHTTVGLTSLDDFQIQYPASLLFCFYPDHKINFGSDAASVFW